MFKVCVSVNRIRAMHCIFFNETRKLCLLRMHSIQKKTLIEFKTILKDCVLNWHELTALLLGQHCDFGVFSHSLLNNHFI